MKIDPILRALVSATYDFEFTPVDKWLCPNPPTDLTDPPSIYETHIGDQVIRIDSWLIKNVERQLGREAAIDFITQEIQSYL